MVLTDLWVAWRAPDGKTGVDLDAVNSAYGLSKSWASTSEVAQRGYPIIGLTEDERCVVLFSEYIGGEVKWPMTLVVLPRYQPVGTEPSDAITSEGLSVDHAREEIAQMTKRLGCGTPA